MAIMYGNSKGANLAISLLGRTIGTVAGAFIGAPQIGYELGKYADLATAPRTYQKTLKSMSDIVPGSSYNDEEIKTRESSTTTTTAPSSTESSIMGGIDALAGIGFSMGGDKMSFKAKPKTQAPDVSKMNDTGLGLFQRNFGINLSPVQESMNRISSMPSLNNFKGIDYNVLPKIEDYDIQDQLKENSLFTSKTPNLRNKNFGLMFNFNK